MDPNTPGTPGYRPAWLQRKMAAAVVPCRNTPAMAGFIEPEVDIVSVRSIIADKPDVDVVRDYFRQEVADLGSSSSSSD